jgi:hypothetical protein
MLLYEIVDKILISYMESRPCRIQQIRFLA